MKVTVKKKNPNEKIPVVISTEFIKLESAMKLANILPSGGTAKLVIQDGLVLVIPRQSLQFRSLPLSL